MRFAKLFFILIGLTLPLTSCNNNGYTENQGRNYSDYENFMITNITKNMYSMSNDVYGIYFYGLTCSHCNDIKGTLFDFLDNFKTLSLENKTLDNFYLFDSGTEPNFRESFKEKPKNFNNNLTEIKNLIEEMMIKPPLKVEDTFFFGTPSLYIIENNTLINLLVGSDEIASYLLEFI